MNPAAIKLFGFLGFLAICLHGVFYHAPEIESRLAAGGQAQLDSAGLAAARVEIDGRDAILAGEVVDEDAAQRAVTALEAVPGIRRVINRLDVVPPPPPPAPPVAQVRLDSLLAGKTVVFRVNSHRIATESYPLLKDVAAILKLFPEARVEIGGHTDGSGLPETNLRLSKMRAEEILKYLVESGVDRNQLSAVGYGVSRPLVEERSREDRETNRRVEFIVMEEE